VAFGAFLTGEPVVWGRLANEHPPRLRTHDRFGNRIDEVEFHPAWHELMRTSIEHGFMRCRGASRSRALTSAAQRFSS
jgi:Adaptive response protein AidB N-terminal domain